MTFQFNGEAFETMNQFSRAYPIYRQYAPEVRDGVSTILELEQLIMKRKSDWLAQAKVQARKNNGFSINRKGSRR